MTDPVKPHSDAAKPAPHKAKEAPDTDEIMNSFDKALSVILAKIPGSTVTEVELNQLKQAISDIRGALKHPPEA